VDHWCAAVPEEAWQTLEVRAGEKGPITVQAVNPQHVQPRLGGTTPAAHRRGLQRQKLPASFEGPTDRQQLAVGRVTFIRRVSTAGTATLLSQSCRVGKRHRGLYLRLVIDTGRGARTAFLNGRVRKRWPYRLLNEEPPGNPAASGGGRRPSAS
jgi:hypothetical protein